MALLHLERADDAATTGLPYHRLGRLGRPRWWRAVLGLVVVLVLAVLWIALVLGVGYAIHEPRLDSSAPDGDLAWEVGLLLVAIAGIVPATLLTVRWVDRRPAGTVTSVAGRMRWRWLLTCGAVCGAVALVAYGVVLVIEPPPGGFDRVDWNLVALVGGVAVALVPLQAAAEEYLFRGYLPQLVGGFVANPWVPAVVLSLLFGLAHGLEQDIWSFADRAGFGLIAAWLAIRTGGLEGAIALHAVGNVASLVVTTIDGELSKYLVGPEPAFNAAGAVIDLALLSAVALTLDRLARRRRLSRSAPYGTREVQDGRGEAGEGPARRDDDEHHPQDAPQDGARPRGVAHPGAERAVDVGVENPAEREQREAREQDEHRGPERDLRADRGH